MTDKKDTNNEEPKKKKGTLKIDTSKLGGKLGGKVTQSFQGGRSKSVGVEVKKRRTFTRDASGKIVEVKKEPEEGVIEQKDIKLTEGEQTSRLKALEESRERAKREKEDAERREQERLEEEKRKKREEEERLALEQKLKQEAKIKKLKQDISQKEIDEADLEKEKIAKEEKKKKISKAKETPDDSLDLEEIMRESIAEVLEDEDEFVDYESDIELDTADPQVYEKKETEANFVAPVKSSDKVILKVPNAERVRKNLLSEAKTTKKTRRKSASQISSQPPKSERPIRKKKKGGKTQTQQMEKIVREIIIPENIEVKELASRMAVRAVDVVKELMKLGMMVTPEKSIDADTAEVIVHEFGHTSKRITADDIENLLIVENEDEEKLQPRPPVVTVMGHVDHGKTSLLDALRSTDVIAGEAGGITQHIGAYQVTLENDKKITFLDTPGHAAFSAMRARGADVTDIVILVVAADDGIMEQTKEAISHAKAAGVPIIVAVNKIDKPDANPQRVINELFHFDLVPEDAGGDTMVVEISAKEKMNLDKLEEAVLLQAEIMELKANPDRPANGVVVESRVDKHKGTVATLLVDGGTLKQGEIVLADKSMGYARLMMDDKGQEVEEAGPTVPVEVYGLDSPPDAGSTFNVVDTEKTAREIIEHRNEKERKRLAAAKVKKTAEDFFASDGDKKTLNVIIKSDVKGSAEAIVGTLDKIETDEVDINPLHTAVGGITESDITLAITTGAVILAFNVRPTPQAKQLANKEGVDIRYYSVIYNLVDDIKALIGGLLSPIIKENFLGIAEIREVFNLSKYGKIAGCMVTEGIIKRGAKVRLLRDNVVIHEGTLKTLKRFKEDVKEVREGYECGAAFENYDDIRENDKIEAFELEEVARTVE